MGEYCRCRDEYEHKVKVWSTVYWRAMRRISDSSSPDEESSLLQKYGLVPGPAGGFIRSLAESPLDYPEFQPVCAMPCRSPGS